MRYSTERKPPLKVLMIKLILIGISCLSLQLAKAQQWKKIDSLSVPYPIVSYAIDQEGKIYLGSAKGDIYRYDEDGVQDKLFSGINYSAVTTIEPWNRLKLFLFYRENQLVVYMDRFITTPTEYLLNELNIGFGSLATPGVDNSFWVLESSFNELRKYREKDLIFTTPLRNIDTKEASHLRAHQNLLILLNPQFGFYFFDQFGNNISELPMKGCNYFHISDHKLITYDGDYIISFDPFQPSGISKLEAPPGAFMGVLKFMKSYYFILPQRIEKYSLIN